MRDFSRIIVLATVPLGLFFQSVAFGEGSNYHINHQFSLLYNGCQKDQPTHANRCGANVESKHKIRRDLVLELHAYCKHNFGVASLAGCGTVTLPTERGNYDIDVPTWKPVACSTIGERRCRMYDYYLGKCLDEILPSDPVPISELENEWVKGTEIRLFSKAGLITDGSGFIRLRVNVMENYYKNEGQFDLHSTPEELESLQQRVRMQETVDEVLMRVRRNKRQRMARDHESSDPISENCGTNADRRSLRGNPSSEEEKSNNIDKRKDLDRTVEVLERVRSRQKHRK